MTLPREKRLATPRKTTIAPRVSCATLSSRPDLLHSIQAYRRAHEFDLIHDHTGYSGTAFGSLIDGPVLCTLHGDFNKANIEFYSHFAQDVYYNAISEAQRLSYPSLNYKPTVYNAIEIEKCTYSSEKEDFLLWLSRVNWQKAPELAIEAAKKLDMRLVMAGKIDPGGDRRFFEKKVLPHIDGERVIFLGEVTEDQKRDLMSRARCFLFPIQWAEPFGLVMPEALASGTPVVAWRNGAAPEIVEDGVTGFLVESLDEMVAAVERIGEIDPARCREEAVRRFSPQRMAADYVAIYHEMLGERKQVS